MATRSDGKPPGHGGLNMGVCGAVVIELGAAGAVVRRGEQLQAAPLTQVVDPLLARAHALLEPEARPPRGVVLDLVAGRFEDAVRDRLVERGVLEHRRGRAWGVLPTSRYLPVGRVGPVDPDALRSRLAAALRSTQPPSGDLASLVGLVGTYGSLVCALLDDQPDRVRAMAAATGLAAVGGDVRSAVLMLLQSAQGAASTLSGDGFTVEGGWSGQYGV